MTTSWDRTGNQQMELLCVYYLLFGKTSCYRHAGCRSISSSSSSASWSAYCEHTMTIIYIPNPVLNLLLFDSFLSLFNPRANSFGRIFKHVLEYSAHSQLFISQFTLWRLYCCEVGGSLLYQTVCKHCKVNIYLLFSIKLFPPTFSTNLLIKMAMQSFTLKWN